MSTFSPSLRIELITTGDQAGVWGNTTNTNLGTLVESAITGYVSVSITSANQALTSLNGAPDESRNQTIALTTTTAAPFAVYAPPAEKTYVIYNASAYAATLYNSTVLGNTTAAGAGAIIPAGKTVTLWSDGTNFVFQNNHLTDLTLVTDLAIADGGTGASTAANARTNLGVTATGADTTYAFRANNLSDLASASAARTNIGLGTIATQNSSSVSITGGSITGITDLAILDGGTGASTAADARTNLGLGTISTQNSNSVSITGGSITGITDLAVADGGTGASTAADARTNLGLGTMAVQEASNVAITGGSITGGSISGITDLAVADGGTGASTAADARTNLGLGTMAIQAASSVAITGGSISGITDLAVADGGTGASTASDARTNLGLGTMAVQSASSVAITGGSISGIADLAIADGGTGASTAADARTNLGLVIGTNVPSPTGTGASGSWGISITGNANTATTAATATTANALNTGNNYTIYNRLSLGISTQSFYGEGSTIGCLSTGGGWLFRSDNSGNFTATANVTAYSDERLKKDWAPLPKDFIERLAKVKHGTYTRIDSGERQAGSSAQDWQKLLPEVVMTANDERGTLSLAYGNAALVAAIKLAEKVVALEERLAKLES